MRKIIDIWVDILEEFNGKMLTQKREAIATVRLSEYMNEELNRSKHYLEKAICNTIDSRGARSNRLWRLIDCLLRIDSQSRGEMSSRLIVQ